jgi:hypothetical protein
MPKSKLIRRDFMKKFKRFLTATIFTTLSILSIAMTPSHNDYYYLYITRQNNKP